MNNQGDDLHPNWCALATIHLPLKRFIKAGEEAVGDARSLEKQKHETTGVTGAEVKNFYETLVKEETNKKVKHHAIRNEPSTKTRSSIKLKSTKQEFDIKKFFCCAQTNDFKSLQNLEINAAQINVCDQYGWTALMMAACEGALEAVQVLLNLGANRNIQDKTGTTALSLAKRKGHLNIVKLLENETNVQQKHCSEPLSFNKTKKAAKPFYCEICKLNFTETTETAHQTSTVHQFNLKSTAPSNKLQRFNISNKNRGLQLMVKQGWDQESGLGPTQTGRLYPVKTVIRKQRTGLGIEQQPARVTHFQAFDERAVKNNKSDYYKKKPRNRNDMRREKVRERKRDKRLRRELS